MASDILVVDDEADIRNLVSGLLEDEGHGTRQASDSDSALAAISDRRPSMIFLDIWLQGSKLKGLGDDHYLYTLRSVDPGVLNSIQLMEEITEEYRLLESGRLPLQIAFALLYVGICLTILLSAVPVFPATTG